jgi:hypothetical protein
MITTPFAKGQGRGLGMDWARILAYVTGRAHHQAIDRGVLMNYLQ